MKAGSPCPSIASARVKTPAQIWPLNCVVRRRPLDVSVCCSKPVVWKPGHSVTKPIVCLYVWCCPRPMHVPISTRRLVHPSGAPPITYPSIRWPAVDGPVPSPFRLALMDDCQFVTPSANRNLCCERCTKRADFQACWQSQIAAIPPLAPSNHQQSNNTSNCTPMTYVKKPSRNRGNSWQICWLFSLISTRKRLSEFGDLGQRRYFLAKPCRSRTALPPRFRPLYS